jgi:hypothetical protein
MDYESDFHSKILIMCSIRRFHAVFQSQSKVVINQIRLQFAQTYDALSQQEVSAPSEHEVSWAI